MDGIIILCIDFFKVRSFLIIFLHLNQTIIIRLRVFLKGLNSMFIFLGYKTVIDIVTYFFLTITKVISWRSMTVKIGYFIKLLIFYQLKHVINLRKLLLGLLFELFYKSFVFVFTISYWAISDIMHCTIWWFHFNFPIVINILWRGYTFFITAFIISLVKDGFWFFYSLLQVIIIGVLKVLFLNIVFLVVILINGLILFRRINYYLLVYQCRISIFITLS